MRLVMSLFVVGFLACVPLAGDASAQRSGTYAVEGVSPDGSRYFGSVDLRPTGPQTWTLNWRINGESATGVGLSQGNQLVVGYLHGRDIGVVVYDVMPDGRLIGRWAQAGSGGVGTETLLPR